MNNYIIFVKNFENQFLINNKNGKNNGGSGAK